MIVPPCINKFYILDLQPENSFVALRRGAGPHGVPGLVAQRRRRAGRISTWDDYLEQGVMQAIDVARDITRRRPGQHAGLLRRRHPARQRARGDARRAARSRRRQPDAADDDARFLRHRRDRPAGRRAGRRGARSDASAAAACCTGRSSRSVFAALRANDLIWPYVVNSYLKGKAPPAFDLLYWNGDDTNLPGPMFCWYLRNTYLREQPARARRHGAVRRAGRPVARSTCRRSSTPRARTTSCRGRRAYASTRAARRRRHASCSAPAATSPA